MHKVSINMSSREGQHIQPYPVSKDDISMRYMIVIINLMSLLLSKHLHQAS